jgi:ABC-type uncharacterized transport system permease subunit
MAEVTRPVDIKGRTIQVRQLTDVQFAVMMREVSLIQGKNVDSRRAIEGIARILDAIESTVVDGDDREYLLNLMVNGELETPDLKPIILAFQDADEPTAPPKVRRGRPPKRALPAA